MLFKDKKHNIAFLSMIIAIVLGVYAQDITYYINKNVINISLSLCIVIVTLISLLLFIVPSVIQIKSNKDKSETDKIMKIYLVLNAIIGVPISAFSLFVMIMWMG